MYFETVFHRLRVCSRTRIDEVKIAKSMDIEMKTQDGTKTDAEPGSEGEKWLDCDEGGRMEDSGKRRDYITWDEYFMGVAEMSARRSKDPSTQVGACIVSPENKILSMGYNGFPQGCSDDAFPWTKVHAEVLLLDACGAQCHSELSWWLAGGVQALCDAVPMQ